MKSKHLLACMLPLVAFGCKHETLSAQAQTVRPVTNAVTVRGNSSGGHTWLLGDTKVNGTNAIPIHAKIRGTNGVSK